MQRLSEKKKSVPPNQPIRFGNKVFTKCSAIAKKFNSQYANVMPHDRSWVARKIKRNLDKNHKLNDNFPSFTLDDTVGAIKQAKYSTAAGPDGLCIFHYKNMGRKALEYLTALFNLSISKADIPAIWKRSIILPVLKPGKLVQTQLKHRPMAFLLSLGQATIRDLQWISHVLQTCSSWRPSGRSSVANPVQSLRRGFS